MLKKIPTDIEAFNKFINTTDDRQKTYHESLIPKFTKEGKFDYTDAVKKIDDKPRWEAWEWTKEESAHWSDFRIENDKLYAEVKNPDNTNKSKSENALYKNINLCVDYDKKHKLIERIFLGMSSYGIDRELFGIQQDLLEYDTPLRKISIKYEKQMPLSDFEKKLIDKYVAMNKQLPETIKYVMNELPLMAEKWPGFFERLFISKEKADKASNTICLPPPVMEGSFSPAVSFYMPTPEESQAYINDFNKYVNALILDLNAHFDKGREIQYLVHEEEDEDTKKVTLHDEVSEMFHKLMDKKKNSIDICSFDQDLDDYRGLWSDERKKMDVVLKAFNIKDNLLGDFYEEFYEFIKDKFAAKREQVTIQHPPGVQLQGQEIDELRMETIQRFESGASTYFDVEDWHIILDSLERKRDETNKAKYLEIALIQHPNHPMLLLRKASEESDKQNYKVALDIINSAENKESGNHPNFFLIKANILCKLHSTDQAIPLYEKLLNAKGMGLENFQKIAYDNLIGIYQKQEKYLECIALTKDQLEKNKKDVELLSELCKYYRLAGLHKEAEEMINETLENNPDNSAIIEQLGHIYFENKEYGKAIKQFEKAYEIDKHDNYYCLFHKGKVLMEMKEYANAAVCFEICILHYHFGKDFHIAASHCYKELDMPYLVDYHISKIIELDPEFTESLNIMKFQGN